MEFATMLTMLILLACRSAPEPEPRTEAPRPAAQATEPEAPATDILEVPGSLPTDAALSPEFHDFPRDLDLNAPVTETDKRLKGVLPEPVKQPDEYATYYLESTPDGSCRALILGFTPDDDKLSDVSVELYQESCDAKRAEFARLWEAYSNP